MPESNPSHSHGSFYLRLPPLIRYVRAIHQTAVGEGVTLTGLEATQAFGAAATSSRARWSESGCSVSLPPKHPLMELALLIFGFGGAVCSVSYGLAFFPPEVYRRCVCARAAVET